MPPTRVSGDQTDWDHRYGTDVHVWSGNPNGTLVTEVTDMPSGRALDVGAGEGGDAVWLAERGWAVTANDISERGLSRVAAEAERRGLSVECLHTDANELGAFTAGGFDLVSMQYGSIHRTPDHRALKNLLGAVAPGGTLLVVGHDPTPWSTPIDVAEQARMFDPDAYLGIDDIATAITDYPHWGTRTPRNTPAPARRSVRPPPCRRRRTARPTPDRLTHSATPLAGPAQGSHLVSGMGARSLPVG